MLSVFLFSWGPFFGFVCILFGGLYPFGYKFLFINKKKKTMCGGGFLSKHPDEAMDFLNYVAETSKAWDEPNPREAERARPSNHQRGGIYYALSEDTEMKAKLTTLTRRLEELEMRSQHEMRAVNELPASQPSCFNCKTNSHPREHRQ